MNISITNQCNRRCNYCFQKRWYLSKNVVEIEPKQFDALLTWIGPRKSINILGGEPLMHSKLYDIFTVLQQHNQRIVFITNLSYDIGPVLKAKDHINMILINTDYPDNQQNVFYQNVIEVLRNNMHMCFSTTLLPYNQWKQASLNRLINIRNLYFKIHQTFRGLSFRISPYSPNTEFRYEIHDFSQDLIKFVQTLKIDKNINVTLDCALNHCEISQHCRSILDSFSVNMPRVCNERNCAFDILVDGSIIYCSSAREIKLDNWRDYPTLKDARKALTQKYNEYMQQHTGCSTNCVYYNDCMHACAGKVTQYQDRVIKFYH